MHIQIIARVILRGKACLRARLMTSITRPLTSRLKLGAWPAEPAAIVLPRASNNSSCRTWFASAKKLGRSLVTQSVISFRRMGIRPVAERGWPQLRVCPECLVRSDQHLEIRGLVAALSYACIPS